MGILLAGGSLTWSRIARFLVSPDLEDHFSDLVQHHLPQPLSDHFRILLDNENLSRGRTHLNLRTCG
jgi:hypothetical protein